MFASMTLRGRVALITGGGSGIGRASAQRLAAEGMRVCVVDSNHEAALAVAEATSGISVTADVSNCEELDEAFARCVEALGRIDVAHLNAGVSLDPGDIVDINVSNYRRSLAVNVDHVVFGTAAAVRAMRATPHTGPRSVVATASLAGIDPFLPNPVYTLTKHAVVGFMRASAIELAAEGVAAHVICPGLTDTAQVPPERKAALVQAGVPFCAPENVADAVVVAITSPLEANGTCWIVNPGEPPQPWNFAQVPGPHAMINLPRKTAAQ
jgi:NAD(P)-dependent dehydrogenase (short-subunit alcohol dehydrogenase family)